MSKKLLTILCVLVCFSFFFLGCKSKPEPVEETPVEEVAPVEEEQKEELTEEQMLAQAQEAIELARKNKTRIEGMELSEYDTASFEAGNSALSEFDALDENASAKTKLEIAKKARDNYQKVLDAAFMSKASEKKGEVENIRKDCLSIKADRADKKRFDATQLTYITAEDAFATKQYEKAYDAYSRSLVTFTEIFQTVSEKKRLADEAMERAKNKTAEVEEVALQADEISPLPEGAIPEEEEETAEESAEETVTETAPEAEEAKTEAPAAEEAN
ncbi:MAG: hypothetical protein K5839_03955 [Treponemataceae bacterium]|nr:hypothetical protein [Treponemataceae bacterium]